MKYPFPSVLDASIITTWKACPRQAWFAHVRRMIPADIDRSVHLVAGGAFAKALEVARNLWYQEGVRDQDAIYIKAIRTLWENYPPDTIIPDRHRAKGPDVLAEGLVKFLDSFNFTYDSIEPARLGNRRGVEFNFALPLPILNPETGDPILYCGRLDMLANMIGDLEALFGEDDKTCSSFFNFSEKWRMRYQFMGYVWAGKESGLELSGMIIRGMQLSLTKLDTLQDIRQFAPWKIERWYAQMLRDVRGIIECWVKDEWDYNYSESCLSYNGCVYVNPCDSIDHEAALLQGGYVANEWSPLVQIKETV